MLKELIELGLKLSQVKEFSGKKERGARNPEILTRATKKHPKSLKTCMHSMHECMHTRMHGMHAYTAVGKTLAPGQV